MGLFLEVVTQALNQALITDTPTNEVIAQAPISAPAEEPNPLMLLQNLSSQ